MLRGATLALELRAAGEVLERPWQGVAGLVRVHEIQRRALDETVHERAHAFREYRFDARAPRLAQHLADPLGVGQGLAAAGRQQQLQLAARRLGQRQLTSLDVAQERAELRLGEVAPAVFQCGEQGLRRTRLVQDHVDGVRPGQSDRPAQVVERVARPRRHERR